MATNHRLIVGSSESMGEIQDKTIQLIITSPPYFNAPFDYVDLYCTYENYLDILSSVAKESFRVLCDGRIFALNIDDMLVEEILIGGIADFDPFKSQAVAQLVASPSGMFKAKSQNPLNLLKRRGEGIGFGNRR